MRLPALLAPVLLLAAAPAASQTTTVSTACVRQCGAASTTVRAHPPEMQACLIRCQAVQNFERSAGRGAATSGRGVPPAPVSRPAPPKDGSLALLQGPLGQRLAAARGGQVPQSRGLVSAAAALPAPARPAAGYTGAIYLAPPPSSGYGLTYGIADRLNAHGQAERNCQARAGGTCRLAMEFTERCGAIAQAKRTNGLFRTSDPSTFTISFAAGGAGPSREMAEGQALADCRSRDRTAACEIVASGCGG